MKLSTAYWESQALLTANRIGLFDVLADKTLDPESIAAKLKTAPRPTRLLLNACVGLGLLEVRPEGFRNSPLSSAFLVSGSPAYMGNAIRYSDNLYGAWGNLETALREDRPTMAPETYLGRDPQKTRDFVYGMHDRALGIGRALAGLVDLSGCRHMLDVGGGPGTYSALFALRYPELQSVVMDLPEVVAIAEEIIAGMGADDRVSTLAGDYMNTPFPKDKDVVLISGVFHRESEATCRRLIERGAESLLPGGLLLISDVFTDAGLRRHVRPEHDAERAGRGRTRGYGCRPLDDGCRVLHRGGATLSATDAAPFDNRPETIAGVYEQTSHSNDVGLLLRTVDMLRGVRTARQRRYSGFLRHYGGR
jgi:predicted O-methyltransferase YrrM